MPPKVTPITADPYLVRDMRLERPDEPDVQALELVELAESDGGGRYLVDGRRVFRLARRDTDRVPLAGSHHHITPASPAECAELVQLLLRV